MANPDTGATFQQLKQELSEFVAREKELAKAELVPAAKHAGIGSGLFAGAGIFLLHALWMLILCGALAIGWVLASNTALSPWGAFTIGFLAAALLSVLIAFVLIKIGQGQIRKVKAPEATMAEASATFSALVDAATGKRPDVELVARPVDDVASLPRRSA